MTERPQLTLYHNKLSPFCHKVVLALEHLNLYGSCKAYDVDFVNQPKWFTTLVNSDRTLPVLAYGGPNVDPENPSPTSEKIIGAKVILEYLAEKHKESNLMPADHVSRGLVRHFIDVTWNNLELPTYEFIQGRGSYEKVLRGMKVVQDLLRDKDFAIGEHYTIADANISPVLGIIMVIAKAKSERLSIEMRELVKQLEGHDFAKIRAFAGRTLERRRDVGSLSYSQVIESLFTIDALDDYVPARDPRDFVIPSCKAIVPYAGVPLITATAISNGLRRFFYIPTLNMNYPSVVSAKKAIATMLAVILALSDRSRRLLSGRRAPHSSSRPLALMPPPPPPPGAHARESGAGTGPLARMSSLVTSLSGRIRGQTPHSASEDNVRSKSGSGNDRNRHVPSSGPSNPSHSHNSSSSSPNRNRNSPSSETSGPNHNRSNSSSSNPAADLVEDDQNDNRRLGKGKSMKNNNTKAKVKGDLPSDRDESNHAPSTIKDGLLTAGRKLDRSQSGQGKSGMNVNKDSGRNCSRSRGRSHSRGRSPSPTQRKHSKGDLPSDRNRNNHVSPSNPADLGDSRKDTRQAGKGQTSNSKVSGDSPSVKGNSGTNSRNKDVGRNLSRSRSPSSTQRKHSKGDVASDRHNNTGQTGNGKFNSKGKEDSPSVKKNSGTGSGGKDAGRNRSRSRGRSHSRGRSPSSTQGKHSNGDVASDRHNNTGQTGNGKFNSNVKEDSPSFKKNSRNKDVGRNLSRSRSPSSTQRKHSKGDVASDRHNNTGQTGNGKFNSKGKEDSPSVKGNSDTKSRKKDAGRNRSHSRSPSPSSTQRKHTKGDVASDRIAKAILVAGGGTHGHQSPKDSGANRNQSHHEAGGHNVSKNHQSSGGSNEDHNRGHDKKLPGGHSQQQKSSKAKDSDEDRNNTGQSSKDSDKSRNQGFLKNLFGLGGHSQKNLSSTNSGSDHNQSPHEGHNKNSQSSKDSGAGHNHTHQPDEDHKHSHGKKSAGGHNHTHQPDEDHKHNHDKKSAGGHKHTGHNHGKLEKTRGNSKDSSVMAARIADLEAKLAKATSFIKHCWFCTQPHKPKTCQHTKTAYMTKKDGMWISKNGEKLCFAFNSARKCLRPPSVCGYVHKCTICGGENKEPGHNAQDHVKSQGQNVKRAPGNKLGNKPVIKPGDKSRWFQTKHEPYPVMIRDPIDKDKEVCWFCGTTEHAPSMCRETSNGFLTRQKDGSWAADSGEKICFVHNGIGGCIWRENCRHIHKCSLCGEVGHDAQTHSLAIKKPSVNSRKCKGAKKNEGDENKAPGHDTKSEMTGCCWFCGHDNHAPRQCEATENGYLTKSSDGIWYNQYKERVCFLHNGNRGCLRKCDFAHVCSLCGNSKHTMQTCTLRPKSSLHSNLKENVQTSPGSPKSGSHDSSNGNVMPEVGVCEGS